MQRRPFHLPAAVLLLVSLLAAGADMEVTAVGRAPGDTGNARERALSDALRDAVRQGAGVDLISATKVTNFELEFDRVFAHAFGFVRNYRVVKQYVDEAGLYTVEIEATVGKGVPGRDDKLALMQTVRLKGSPRVGITVAGVIADVGPAAPLAQGLFKELALETQLQVVDAATVKDATDRRARRDELLGDQRAAELRRADISSRVEFLIDATVSGSYVGEESLFGVPTRRFSVGIDLSAAWADTGEAIAQVTVPSRDLNSTKGDAKQAARDCLQRVLRGDPRGGDPDRSVLTLLHRILARWITELDLGARIQIELKQIGREEFDGLLAALRETEGIGWAWAREFDGRLISLIEVESRLDADQLKDEVLRHIGVQFESDRVRPRFLQFVRKEAPQLRIPQTPPVETQPAASDGRTGPVTGASATGADAVHPDAPRADGTAGAAEPDAGLSAWLYAVLGAGAVGLIWGAFALGRKTGK